MRLANEQVKQEWCLKVIEADRETSRKAKLGCVLTGGVFRAALDVARATELELQVSTHMDGTTFLTTPSYAVLATTSEFKSDHH